MRLIKRISRECVLRAHGEDYAPHRQQRLPALSLARAAIANFESAV